MRQVGPGNFRSRWQPWAEPENKPPVSVFMVGWIPVGCHSRRDLSLRQPFHPASPQCTNGKELEIRILAMGGWCIAARELGGGGRGFGAANAPYRKSHHSSPASPRPPKNQPPRVPAGGEKPGFYAGDRGLEPRSRNPVSGLIAQALSFARETGFLVAKIL